MWEELAEDPFRGLRAGPATFSPFLFSCQLRTANRLCRTPEKLQNVDFEEGLKCPRTEENTKRWDGLMYWRAELALVNSTLGPK
jgi:hypothetical protein